MLVRTNMSGQGKPGSQFHMYRLRSKLAPGLLGWISDLLAYVHLVLSGVHGSSTMWQGLDPRQIAKMSAVAI